jgi:DNA-binding response OmpR family regulator
MSEARTRLRDGDYRLAVLDLNLDDGRGSDLIPDLRAHAPGARIVLLSAEPTDGSGADVVLSKDLEPPALIERLVAELR